jgi:hypothetical protein
LLKELLLLSLALLDQSRGRTLLRELLGVNLPLLLDEADSCALLHDILTRSHSRRELLSRHSLPIENLHFPTEGLPW